MKKMTRVDWTIEIPQKEWLIQEAKRRNMTASKLLRKIIAKLMAKQNTQK